MPKARARRAVAWPIAPSPTMPSVRPCRPVPEHEVERPRPRLLPADQPLALREAPRDHEDQRHREVGRGVDEHARRVGGDHAARPARLDVDVVVAHGDVRDDPQAGAGRVQQRVVDAVVQQRHQALGAGDRRLELVGASARGRAARPTCRARPAGARGPAPGCGATTTTRLTARPTRPAARPWPRAPPRGSPASWRTTAAGSRRRCAPNDGAGEHGDARLVEQAVGERAGVDAGAARRWGRRRRRPAARRSSRPGSALRPRTTTSRRRRNSSRIASTASRGPSSAATPASCTAGGVQETELTIRRVIGSTSALGHRGVAQPPAGHGEGLGEAVQEDGAIEQPVRGDGVVRRPRRAAASRPRRRGSSSRGRRGRGRCRR